MTRFSRNDDRLSDRGIHALHLTAERERNKAPVFLHNVRDPHTFRDALGRMGASM